MADDSKTSHRRSYGKGYYDGLRAAGVMNSSEALIMNQARYKTLYDGLTANARKIYEAVPNKTYWTSAQIKDELQRTGSSYDKKVVDSCLYALVGNGMVLETTKGMYIKEKIKGADAKGTQMAEHLPTNVTPIIKQKLSPIELLTNLAEQARQLADELENAALEIDQDFQDSIEVETMAQELGCNSNRITSELIESRITAVEYKTVEILGQKLMYCGLKMDNGFVVIGKPATCIDPANWRDEIGEKISYDNSFDEIWRLEAYRKLSEERA